MGAWGAGLYSNDEAEDFLPLIRTILKLPMPLDELVDFLKTAALEEIEGDTAFWLMMADQLEKKGIRHALITDTAIRILESSADITEMLCNGFDEKDLKPRIKANAKLLARLKSPRPQKPRKTLKTPQKSMVNPGDYVCYPTHAGIPACPYAPPGQEPRFVPNGWGLFQVHNVGWEFGYLNWIEILTLKWLHKHRPTFEEALNAPAIDFRLGTLPAGHFKKCI